MGRPLIACSGRVGASPAQEGHAGVNDLRGPHWGSPGLLQAPGCWDPRGPPGTRHSTHSPTWGSCWLQARGCQHPRAALGAGTEPLIQPLNPGASQGSAQRLCPAPAELVRRLKAQRLKARRLKARRLQHPDPAWCRRSPLPQPRGRSPPGFHSVISVTGTAARKGTELSPHQF